MNLTLVRFLPDIHTFRACELLNNEQCLHKVIHNMTYFRLTRIKRWVMKRVTYTKHRK